MTIDTEQPRLSRRLVLARLALDTGPTPEMINFVSESYVSIAFDSVAEAIEWAEHHNAGQPDVWTKDGRRRAAAYFEWLGWRVQVTGTDQARPDEDALPAEEPVTRIE